MLLQNNSTCSYPSLILQFENSFCLTNVFWFTDVCKNPVVPCLMHILLPTKNCLIEMDFNPGTLSCSLQKPMLSQCSLQNNLFSVVCFTNGWINEISPEAQYGFHVYRRSSGIRTRYSSIRWALEWECLASNFFLFALIYSNDFSARYTRAEPSLLILFVFAKRFVFLASIQHSSRKTK